VEGYIIAVKPSSDGQEQKKKKRRKRKQWDSTISFKGTPPVT
jgi:hypothetical protein